MGYFEKLKPGEFDGWSMYTNFIVMLATNGICCPALLPRIKNLNPDMTYLDDIRSLYERMADIWHNDGGSDLKALGGGFNVTLETLQIPEKREKNRSTNP